jgi:hypothetical protein
MVVNEFEHERIVKPWGVKLLSSIWKMKWKEIGQNGARLTAREF